METFFKIFLKAELYRMREGEKERGLPSSGLHPKWPQQLVSQAATRSQELLSHGHRDPSTWAIFHYFAGTWGGSWIRPFYATVQAPWKLIF